MKDKITVIGLGNCGCALASKFEVHPRYKVLKLDKHPSSSKGYFRLPDFDKPEKYEEAKINFKKFFSRIKGEVLFLVGGSGIISNASLVVLSQAKHCKIRVLYVRPDHLFLSENATLTDNLVFNVFQQYARSGVFEELLIVSNTEIEKLLGDVSVVDYYSGINDAIVYSVHTLNCLKRTTPIFGNLSEPLEVSRISTIGKVNLETGEETLFFSLDKVREKSYYYIIGKKNIQEDKNLLRRIKEQMRKKYDPTIKISFGIFESDIDENFALCMAHSATIQKPALL